MEGLSKLIHRGEELGRISGFSMRSNGSAISHLQYADDTMLFLNADFEMVEFCISLLKCFEVVSGLRINMAKTKLIPVGEVPLLQEWAVLIGCCVESLPTKYLGMPLGQNPKSISMWDSVLEILDRKLSTWNSKMLSKGGKVTLVKSVLTNLPIYFLSVFLAPKKVITAMERKIKRFLWSNGEAEESYHLVNWLQVCCTKESKGLGIKQLHLMNKALLSKWCWRYGSETNSLWRKLIVEKFGFDTRWHPNIPRITQGVGCWRRIITLAEDYCQNLVFELHSGSSIRFWHDNWLSGGPLSATCPLLFAISKHKKASVKRMTTLRDGETVWNLSFKRELDMAESDELTILLLIIGSPPPLQDISPDTCSWRIAPSSSFSVRQFYAYHNAILAGPVDAEFPHHFIWKSPVPLRVRFFVWTACLNRCLTVDNLNKRGKFIVSRCPLCKAALETLDHILLHCRFSMTVWNAFKPQVNWVWNMPQWPVDMARLWKAKKGWSERGKILWSIMPIAVWWGLWWERNARTFQRVESSPEKVIDHIRSLIFAWASIISVCSNMTLREIALNWENSILLGDFWMLDTEEGEALAALPRSVDALARKARLLGDPVTWME